ncbi:MAG TPA: hypothetical protein DEP35_09735 [Deltaproteobacteria bacterium]|jgi:hypothetical protein|nr:hypothetical protein [Deltaproteobacteria bacterium]
MHFPSLDMRDPVFDAYGLSLSVQVVTFENLYGVDPAQTSARFEGQAFVVRSAGLAWAGQREKAPGAVLLRVRPEGSGRFRVHVRAKAPEAIRCTKLLVRGLAAPLAWVDESGLRPVAPLGESLAYPHQLGAPLVCLRAGDETLGVRVEDARVREKRFAASLERVGERAGQGVLEVICEEGGPRPSRELEAPPVLIRRGAAREALLAEHEAFARGAYGGRSESSCRG